MTQVLIFVVSRCVAVIAVAFLASVLVQSSVATTALCLSSLIILGAFILAGGDANVGNVGWVSRTMKDTEKHVKAMQHEAAHTAQIRVGFTVRWLMVGALSLLIAFFLMIQGL